MIRILVIEDEGVIRTALCRLLDRSGYETAQAESVEQAREVLGREGTDLIIADVRLPGSPGTAIITEHPEIPVLVMTSYASVRSAVEAMKLGAVDYIAKPFDHEEMLLCVDRILKHGRLERQNRALKSDVARSYPIAGMIGRCESMRRVFAHIDKVAPADTTVLILGESGTGKELVARALHEKSPRRDAPMVTVNCAAIPSGLIENELFGHEKGSFTGAVGTHHGLVETADGGTLFLDEIGELSIEAQARLLRVMQDGEIRRVGAAHPRRVDIRLVAATHRDLPVLVREGRFREDLYFRLRVVELRLPPLRERGDDIHELAQTLLEKTCRRLNKPLLRLTPDAAQAVRAYPWPGNVRELENAVERAVILCEGPELGPQLLSLPPLDERAVAPAPTDEPHSELSLEAYFRHFVERHQGHLTETELAERLGISRKSLWERRQRLGIQRKKGTF
jgi:DNA-binding NtrC family response regulator